MLSRLSDKPCTFLAKKTGFDIDGKGFGNRLQKKKTQNYGKNQKPVESPNSAIHEFYSARRGSILEPKSNPSAGPVQEHAL